ncbi:MAG: hypothetical protein FWF23_05345 [Alphaproteobacteria bacterium]|nr:hypothetical protein [Alphaproteobacteria bacterium]MCL2505299.1 hypothetical protein [Alphaproteobacteria bacterium]
MSGKILTEYAIINRIVEANTGLKQKPADTRKINVVLEGGGMRGVIGAGALSAFESLGRLAQLTVVHNGDFALAVKSLNKEQESWEIIAYRNAKGIAAVADKISATSIGAPLSLFAVTGDARLTSPIIFHDMAGTKFLDMKRMKSVIWALATKEVIGSNGNFAPPMDLKYAKDLVENELHFDALKENRVPIYFAAANLDTMKLEFLGIQPADETDTLDRFEAACIIPGIGGYPKVLNGHRYSDSMASPLALMLQQGLKDDEIYVVISTRSLDNRMIAKTGIADRATNLAARLVLKNDDEYKAYIRLCAENKCLGRVATNEGYDKGNFYFTGASLGYKTPSNSTTDEHILKDATDDSYLNTMRSLAPVLAVVLQNSGIELKNVNEGLANLQAPGYWNKCMEPKPERRFSLSGGKSAFTKING